MFTRAVLAAAALATIGAALVSGAGSAATEAVPTNISEPRISGTPIVGRTLTATQGTWSGSPTSFSFRWVRCPASGGNASGSDCTAIAGATTHLRGLLRGRRTASARACDRNERRRLGHGSLERDRARTRCERADEHLAPDDLAARRSARRSPPIPARGRGAIRPSHTRGGAVTPTAGAARRSAARQSARTSSSPSIQGTRFASGSQRGNQDGSGAATSAPTPVARRRRAARRKRMPARSGPISIDQLAPPARLLVDGQRVSPPVVSGSTSTLTVRFHVLRSGRSVSGALVYVTGVPATSSRSRPRHGQLPTAGPR